MEQALRTLDPGPHLNKDNPMQNFILWLDEVHASQNAVSSAINLSSQNEMRIDSRYDLIVCIAYF